MAMKAAAVCAAVAGLGFGIPCAFGIRHFAQTGEVWTFLGFPTTRVTLTKAIVRGQA